MHVNIKSRKLLKPLLITLPTLLLCVAIFRIVVARADIVYPNPETESAFLKSYTLANAIVPGSPLASGVSGPDSAHHGCASHQREFQFWVAIPRGRDLAVMAGVRRDIESRLTRQGSQIIGASGDPLAGFQYDYAVGKTKGSVFIDPLVLADSFASQAGPGQLAVKLRVRISETWYMASEKNCRKL